MRKNSAQSRDTFNLAFPSGIARLFVFGGIILGGMGCASRGPNAASWCDGGTVCLGESLQLEYFGDYEPTHKVKMLYPIYDPTVMKPLQVPRSGVLASTSLEPYMATSVSVSTVADTTSLRSFLTQAGARWVYIETPSDPRVIAYARYIMDSRQFPIQTHFCEFLIQGEGENAPIYRALWWSNEAGENMRREAWKVVGTLTTRPN